MSQIIVLGIMLQANYNYAYFFRIIKREIEMFGEILTIEFIFFKSRPQMFFIVVGQKIYFQGVLCIRNIVSDTSQTNCMQQLLNNVCIIPVFLSFVGMTKDSLLQMKCH